jgi:putative oxidoreductase
MNLRTLRRTALDTLRRLDWAPPLLARLVIGAVFVPAGWGKLHALSDVTAFFRDLGIPYPEVQAPFVSSVELACGALVLTGLATRLAAAPLIGTMLVAIATAIWPNLGSPQELFGKEELHYVALLAYLAVSGPGSVSADAAITRLAATTRPKSVRRTALPKSVAPA